MTPGGIGDRGGGAPVMDQGNIDCAPGAMRGARCRAVRRTGRSRAWPAPALLDLELIAVGEGCLGTGELFSDAGSDVERILRYLLDIGPGLVDGESGESGDGPDDDQRFAVVGDGDAEHLGIVDQRGRVSIRDHAAIVTTRSENTISSLLAHR